jgi:hypothetical protein
VIINNAKLLFPWKELDETMSFRAEIKRANCTLYGTENQDSSIARRQESMSDWPAETNELPIYGTNFLKYLAVLKLDKKSPPSMNIKYHQIILKIPKSCSLLSNMNSFHSIRPIHYCSPVSGRISNQNEFFFLWSQTLANK